LEVSGWTEMKILIAECSKEVSTFSPVLTRYEDFSISSGSEILEAYRGGDLEIGGALAVFDERPDVDVLPAYSARYITSGGTMAAADFDRLAGELLAQLRAAPPADAFYFCLHGALATEQYDDAEGYLLAESRKILGESIPIVISLDLHCVLTDAMLTNSTAAVLYHTYPHVDFFETGGRAAGLLLRILDDNLRPVSARVEIPALVRGDELRTETGLFGEIVRSAQQIEATPSGLSAGMVIGNPFTDVPDLRSYSLVVTDGDEELAQREALRLADDFWRVHERFQPPLTSMEEAIRIARETQGTVAIFDPADATSSGASGDSNAVMRAFMEAGYAGTVLSPVVDPPAVQAAFAAGVGESIETTLGGSLDPERFDPLAVNARVLRLSNGRFVNESHGTTWDAGPTAVLEAGNHIVVVTTRPVSLYDRSLFLAHDQDPQKFDVVVVKTPHAQPHMFDDWCARRLVVDTPGATSANLHRLGHTKCRRPVFPLDKNVPFHPKAKLFRSTGM
jgi:microcystin degradation protein MlrC